MRVLMMSSPVPTHLMPLLPLAWALRGAGHEVLLAGQADLAGTAGRSGLSFVPIGTEQREVEARRAHRAAGGRDPGGAGGSRTEPPWELLARRWRERVTDVLPDALELARAWRPDLLLADPLEYASLVVGATLELPVVHHRWGVDSFSTRSFPRVRAALGDLCPDGELPEPALVLDPCPASLQDPQAAPGTPLRPGSGAGSGLLPGWVADRRAPRRVCVTLGLRTVALEGPAVLAPLLRGLGGLPGVETVATVERGHRAALGPLPASVRLVDPAPLDLVLPSCDAVVHHGGSGTGLAAIAAGLPQLVVPQTPWTAEHGERVAATGVGLLLTEPEPAAVAAATARLLDDDRFRAATAQLRTELRAMPSPAAVVPRLQLLARTSRRLVPAGV